MVSFPGRPCVVTLLDLIGIKKLIAKDKANAVTRMEDLRKTIRDNIIYGKDVDFINHAYTFSDSAILLSYLDVLEADCSLIIRQADRLKKLIDSSTGLESYAIAVKGETYSEPIGGRDYSSSGDSLPGASIMDNADPPTHTHIRASSIAFSNCFTIEHALGKMHRKSWYLDCRITSEAPSLREPDCVVHLELLPNMESREIHMFDGYLWGKIRPCRKVEDV